MIHLGITWQGHGCDPTWHNLCVSHQLSCSEKFPLNMGQGAGGAVLSLGSGDWMSVVPGDTEL